MTHRVFLAAILAVLLAPAVSHAQFKQGDWDWSVSGSGSNDKDFRTYNYQISSQYGYFITDQLELGLRPSALVSDGGSDHLYLLNAFGDYHFDLGKWAPFVGGNVGYQFGSRIAEDGWIAGPEVGVKYFVSSSTYVQFIAQYEWNLNVGVNSGAFFYGLGLGVKL